MLVKVNNKNLKVAFNIINHRSIFGLLILENERKRRRGNKSQYLAKKWKLYKNLHQF